MGRININIDPTCAFLLGEGMKISIDEINPSNFKDVNQCDGEFIIASKLVLSLEHGQIHYSTIEVPVTRKRYGRDERDYSEYVSTPDRVVYLAYMDGQIAGQLVLRKNWNGFAYIEDITVDIRFRRKGIGQALISQAEEWARCHKLVGIMLETQDNNVPACKFYESCGFQMRGFDSYLYKGIERVRDEVALYWYVLFSEKGESGTSEVG